MKQLKMLSIDGGGLRGYAPASTLKEIETDFDFFKTNQYFDIFAGTSTGALLSFALLLGDDIDSIIETYKNGKKLFFIKERKKNILKKLIFPQYKIDGIMQSLAKSIDEKMTLNDLYKQTKKTVMIFATDFKHGKPVIFATPDIKGKYVIGGNYKITDIILSAIGAPGYFPLHKIKINNEFVHLGDGGLWANNPAGMAASLINSSYKNYHLHVMSFGNEYQEQLLFHDKYNQLKPIKLSQDLIKVATRASMNAANIIAKDFSETYLRITMHADFYNPLNKLTPEYIKLCKNNYLLNKNNYKKFFNEIK